MAAVAHPISHFSSPQGAIVDLSNSKERDRLSPSAIRGFIKLIEQWSLNEPQARALLGGIASSTYHTWKGQPDGRSLSQDTLTRISLLLGIYKALHVYFGDSLADQWLTYANEGSPFLGRTPIDYLISRGLPGFVEVRNMLDAWCQGN